jgi:hypothetical protein
VAEGTARPRAVETAGGSKGGGCGSISVHGRSRDLLRSGVWWMGKETEAEGFYST